MFAPFVHAQPSGGDYRFRVAPGSHQRHNAASMKQVIRGFALFDTPIGTCALAWSGKGIVAVQLPERTAAETQARMERRYPEARETPLPPTLHLAIDRIVALLNGEPADLSSIALDMTGVPDFNARVYAVARTIPPGETMTYGDIARELGEPGAARAVGAALGANPFAIVVPCHRVLAANGKAGGFSANGGVTTKMRMLTIERARRGSTPTLFDDVGGLPLATARRTPVTRAVVIGGSGHVGTYLVPRLVEAGYEVDQRRARRDANPTHRTAHGRRSRRSRSTARRRRRPALSARRSATSKPTSSST